MGMVVRTNMAGLNANNALNMASKTQQNAMQKLASGFRINKAGDDASGLAISEKMKNQIKALDTASDNCEDGANMIQTAEGYMAETHDILNRMTELAEKAANGVLDDTDRDALQDEMDELCAEIDRMATTANFNGQKLMDGSQGSKGKVKLFADKFDKKVSYLGPETNSRDGIVIDKGNLTEGNYTISGNATAATGSSKATVNVSVDGELREIKLQVKDGDKIFLASGSGNAEATTAFGASVAFGSNVGKDTVYTYNAKEDAWYDQDNVKATSVTVNWGKFAGGGEINVKEGINLQIGESSTQADRLGVTMNSFHTDTLFGGLDGFVNATNDDTNTEASSKVNIIDSNKASMYNDAVTIDISDKDAASAAADAIRQVSNYVSDERGRLGAQQNRLEHTVNNLNTTSENITAANSRIRDTNMAEEMMNYTSKNVIAQAAQAMLAQANSQPQNVLSLLQ